MATKCIGVEVSSGEAVILECDKAIVSLDPLLDSAADLPYLSPGWIDLQVNGFAGVDYNNPAERHEEIARSIHAQYATGVSRFYPTVITGSFENICGALRNLAQAKETLTEGAAMEGFHVEGPHISPDDGPRGAHPRQHVRPPDFDEFKRWQDAARGNVRLVTVSPEYPEMPAYIERVVREGVVVSIGHTKADAGQIRDAVNAGASMSTHLGNGAHAELPRHPNYIWEQLAEDRLAASFIVDGIHLSNSFLKVALRAKGIERSILVTDAVMPAGCAPGPYNLGEVEVELHPPGDRVTLRGGWRLAGSALRMDRGIENLMKLANLSLREAVVMASQNPARVGRISGRRRGLAPGERGDVVQFRFNPDTRGIEVEKTFVSGEQVYSKN